MVVNLADPGESVLRRLVLPEEVADAKTADLVKQYALYSQRHLDAGLPTHF